MRLFASSFTLYVISFSDPTGFVIDAEAMVAELDALRNRIDAIGTHNIHTDTTTD